MEKSSDMEFGFSRCRIILAWVVLGIVSALLAAYIGMMRVELKKQTVLNRCASAAGAWLEGTVTAVRHWEEENRELRLRISEHETYRLFAGDLGLTDNAAIMSIMGQTGNGTDEQKSGGAASSVTESIPDIRNSLKDFIDLNGFFDARIINPSGQTLLSAQIMPTALTSAQINAAVKTAQTGQRVIMPVRDCSGGLMLDVFEPMLGMDASHNIVGVMMVSRPVLADITQFSARPKPAELSEAVFLQRVEIPDAHHTSAIWETVTSPLPKQVLHKELSAALEAGNGVLPLAMRQSFSTLGTVYSAVLPVLGLDWSVALEIPAAAVEHRIMQASIPVYFAVFFGWLAFLLLCMLVWWIAIGRRRNAVVARLQSLHRQLSRQKELLDSVNKSLDFGLFLADVKGYIHLCNRDFAQMVGSSENEVTGQTIFACLPASAASEILEHIRKAAVSGNDDSFELQLNPHERPLVGESGQNELSETPDSDKCRLYRISLSPFLDSAQANVRTSLRGAVVTVKDITEFRRRSETVKLRQLRLIEAFTGVEAVADPYLHGHSRRMATLGEKVARGMGLAEDHINTIIMGAQLSQLGKLFIPRELLGKTSRLTTEELAEVRRAPEHAAHLLEPVDFDLPIARAVYEMSENVDGTGYPRGLKGDEILFEARVLNVLNAYCAMVSDRAYREGMSTQKALESLRSSTAFDQEIVEQLARIVKE